jgi:hypothetical protein
MDTAPRLNLAQCRMRRVRELTQAAAHMGKLTGRLRGKLRDKPGHAVENGGK